MSLVRGEGVLCEEVEDHPSLDTKHDATLSLEECLSVFSQRSVSV